MGRTIDLKARKSILRLVTNDIGWCTVLYFSQSWKSLGAETFSYIKEKLCHTLQRWDALEICGEIQGKNVAWVLSLNELHTTIYASKVNRDMTLFFQDKHAVVSDSMFLNETDREVWIDILGCTH